jgi:hypothetical protein
MASPDGARATLAAHLAAQIPNVDVWSSPRAVSPQQRGALVIAIRQIVNADMACPDRRVLLDIWAVSAMVDDSGAADDDVDQLCASVLDALDLSPRTSWTNATRQVWLDKQACYRIESEMLL